MNVTDKSTPTLPDSEKGYLTVRVSTARGAIPLEGATVNIRANEADFSAVIYSLLSDRDGKTPRIALDAPPARNSAAPGDPTPYATYNIDVFKDGYTPIFFHNVPVFAGVTSVQPAVMVPAGIGEINVDEGYNPSNEQTVRESEERL